MTKRIVPALCIYTSICAASCAATPTPKKSDEPRTVNSQQATPAPLTLPGKKKKVTDALILSDPGMQKFVTLAKQDLVALLRIHEKKIEVLEARYVTWPDSSIGCPRPGMHYMQALSNGVRIQLGVNGKSYYYHSGGKKPLFRCPNPSPSSPVPYEYGDT